MKNSYFLTIKILRDITVTCLLFSFFLVKYYYISISNNYVLVQIIVLKHYSFPVFVNTRVHHSCWLNFFCRIAYHILSRKMETFLKGLLRQEGLFFYWNQKAEIRCGRIVRYFVRRCDLLLVEQKNHHHHHHQNKK
jgi:hypothetical protein